MTITPNPAKTTRLFLNTVELTASVTSVREGTLSLKIGEKTYDLLTATPRGVVAGNIPLVPGEQMDLEKSYYFELPSDISSEAQVVFSAKTGIFSSHSETFQLNSSSCNSIGKSFKAKGNRGSEINLVPMYYSDIVIFVKDDLRSFLGDLKSTLATQGFKTVDSYSPLGFQGEINSVWVGKQVPFQQVQSILRVLMKYNWSLEFQPGAPPGRFFRAPDKKI